MFCYLYDAFLRDRKYQTQLAKIESRLFELGIQGKSEKLTILKSMRDLAEAAIKRGADTLIVVGDDQTVSKLIGLIAQYDVVLGIIPLGKDLRIAEYLGIPEGVKACDTLSTRIVERIDLGKANETFFLSFLEVAAAKELFLDFDGGAYSLETGSTPHTVSVYNFGMLGKDPRDGLLEIVVRPAEREQKKSGFRKRHERNVTILPMKKVRVKSFASSVPVHADGQTVLKTPVTVTVVPKKLRVIVGKDRGFV